MHPNVRFKNRSGLASYDRWGNGCLEYLIDAVKVIQLVGVTLREKPSDTVSLY